MEKAHEWGSYRRVPAPGGPIEAIEVSYSPFVGQVLACPVRWDAKSL